MIYISFIGSDCEELQMMYREREYSGNTDFFKERNGHLYKFNALTELLEARKQSHVIITAFDTIQSCTTVSRYCKSLEAKCVFIFVNFFEENCRMLINNYGPAKYIYYDGLTEIYNNGRDPLKLFALTIRQEDVYIPPQIAPAQIDVVDDVANTAQVIARVDRDIITRVRELLQERGSRSKKNFSKLVVLDFLAKQHYETLPKPIKCPVCIEEIPYEKFVLLCCGHYHCKSCLERLDKCSVCRYTG